MLVKLRKCAPADIELRPRAGTMDQSMTSVRQDHWNTVYTNKQSDQVSWFQHEPTLSLTMIQAAGIGKEASIVDVGGGASTLVDHLIERGFHRLTVLDISAQALGVARARLGERASGVDWAVQDAANWQPAENAYDLWHDRAVFHFLTEPEDRQGYLRALNRGLRPGGFVVLAPFALTGPGRCSGFPVQRYSPETLQAALGPAYQLLSARPETHVTPAGNRQDFVWCLFRKVGDSAAQ